MSNITKALLQDIINLHIAEIKRLRKEIERLTAEIESLRLQLETEKRT